MEAPLLAGKQYVYTGGILRTSNPSAWGQSMLPPFLRSSLSATTRALLAIGAICSPAWAAVLTEADPLGALTWSDLKREFVGQAPVVFNPAVRVQAPQFAEDPMNVPVSVSVEGLDNVEQIMVVVDRNPIRKVLEYFPSGALPNLSFRFKLEQGSPVRALVRTRDGRWHAGGTFVDSSGGGCTVSGATRKDGSWAQTLGQVAARTFDSPSSTLLASTAPGLSSSINTRLRFRVMHPMDTGLVNGIPAFHLNKLQLSDTQGKVLLRMNVFEPVSENPVFSFDFPGRNKKAMVLSGTDNNGNRVQARIE
jgi:sulfur-oxidizing protein SoxY